jgi:hypothetical protein
MTYRAHIVQALSVGVALSVIHAAPAPAPAASLGTALALDANGDVACLLANDARTTCVMSYVSRSRQRCVRAAWVPLARPTHAVALGAPVCDQAAARRNLTIGPFASTSAGHP